MEDQITTFHPASATTQFQDVLAAGNSCSFCREVQHVFFSFCEGARLRFPQARTVFQPRAQRQFEEARRHFIVLLVGRLRLQSDRARIHFRDELRQARFPAWGRTAVLFLQPLLQRRRMPKRSRGSGRPRSRTGSRTIIARLLYSTETTGRTRWSCADTRGTARRAIGSPALRWQEFR